MRKFEAPRTQSRRKPEKNSIKMNDQKLDKKIRKDAAKVKKDLHTLVRDSTTRMGRYEDNASQATGKAKEDLTTWVVNRISQLSKGFKKLTGDAKETVVGTAATVKKDVEHGLSHYNVKSQEVADRVPGSFGKKTAVPLGSDIDRPGGWFPAG